MAEDMLMIPYGKTDFAVMRREGYYYVDKTRFIRNLEREGNFVIFLRPRRFGKSLMTNVLHAYYDVNYADEFDVMFGNLDIGKNPTPKHNQYLILKFNFSAVNPTKDKVNESFNEDVLTTIRTFSRMYESYLPKGTYKSLLTYSACDSALNYLFDQVKLAKQHIYLLIDEYDNFANTMMAEDDETNNRLSIDYEGSGCSARLVQSQRRKAEEEGEKHKGVQNYLDLTHGDGFFRLFFNILKEATTDVDAVIERMFITGVTPLTLSDVTSGFNIGSNFSLKSKYNEMVGFSESEVREMLAYYRDQTGVFQHSVDELIEIMKPWYNNNCFSTDCIEDQRMFNSDMTLFFVENYIGRGGKIPEEMLDTNVTSDYNKMRKMVKLDKSFGEKGRIMQNIFERKSINAKVKPEFSLHELQSSENLPSMLFYMGLLTYGMNRRNRPCLVIPNNVVFEQYYMYMAECYKRCLNWYSDLDVVYSLRERLIYDGEAQPLLEYLCHQITTDSSIRDFDPQAEAFVKGFLLAKLGGTNNSYLIVTTEPEENHGYSDLYMEPWNDDCEHSFLIELKYCNHNAPDSEVEQKHQEALAQLEKYSTDKALQQKAESNGWTLHKLAVVFRGWECQLCEEVL